MVQRTPIEGESFPIPGSCPRVPACASRKTAAPSVDLGG